MQKRHFPRGKAAVIAALVLVLKDILNVAMSMTQNDIINTTSFSPEIFAETDSALALLQQGTETIGKQVDISEGNPYLRQGDNDEWEAYNENAYDQRQKQIWLDQSYRHIVEGSQQELAGMETGHTMP